MALSMRVTSLMVLGMIRQQNLDSKVIDSSRTPHQAADWVECAHSFRFLGLAWLAFDKFLGLANKDVGNNPIVPLFIETRFARLGKTRFGELKTLGQRDARLIALVELVLRHSQRHVGLNRAVH